LLGRNQGRSRCSQEPRPRHGDVHRPTFRTSVFYYIDVTRSRNLTPSVCVSNDYKQCSLNAIGRMSAESKFRDLGKHHSLAVATTSQHMWVHRRVRIVSINACTLEYLIIRGLNIKLDRTHIECRTMLCFAFTRCACLHPRPATALLLQQICSVLGHMHVIAPRKHSTPNRQRVSMLLRSICAFMFSLTSIYYKRSQVPPYQLLDRAQTRLKDGYANRCRRRCNLDFSHAHCYPCCASFALRRTSTATYCAVKLSQLRGEMILGGLTVEVGS
jgi:hypothetical protein